MRISLLTLHTLALATLLAGPALAQSPARRFKPTTRPATLPVAAPHPDVVLDGQATGQLQQQAGPRTNSTLLPAFAMPAGPEVRVQRAAESGLPIMLSVAPGTASARTAGKTPAEVSLAFLDAHKTELQLRQPSQEFKVLTTSTDQLGQTHVRLAQQYLGVPVYGAEVLVHLDASGQPTLFTGRYVRTPVMLTSVVPTLAAAAAASAAEVALRGKGQTIQEFSAATRQLLHYDGPITELVVYQAAPDVAPVLAWQVTTQSSVQHRWETLVDARTDAVLKQLDLVCNADGPRTATSPDLNGANRTFNTYQVGNAFYLIDASRPMFNAGQSKMPDNPVGALLTLDAGNTDGKTNLSQITTSNNSWGGVTRSAISAHYNAGVAYEYYRTVHKRNSLDGAGGTIISVVRVSQEDGSGLDNAFWNGQFMSYGEGNTEFKPLAGGLDVAGHELTHGVNNHAANLKYESQSGALSEHMSDVFGCAIDPTNWLIGETVALPGAFAGGALRSLADPHNGANPGEPGYQPRVMAEFVNTSQDNGGVHTNSGIPNWAHYKFAQAMGRAHAEQIWYRAFTVYLTSSSQFIDLRLAIIQSATDLYGASSQDVTAAKAAFDAVGILGNTAPTNTTSTLPVNPGQDYILAYNTSSNADGTWYEGSIASGNLSKLSQTVSRCRPSIDDQGRVALFVAKDGSIHSLQLSSPFTEQVIQSSPIWHSVAISKDGNRVAAVTQAADASIYIFDLVSGKSAKAALYNPTTAAGVKGNGVRFADALEWDYSGQHVIYDADNLIPDQNGGGIEYFDIGILNAWNPAAKTFGDGTIQKLVPSLPDGISIGNPSLAKRSPKVLAFDLYDGNSTSDTPFKVMAVNTETGDSGTLFDQNGTVGTPSYSKLDDKLLFTAYPVNGDTAVAVTSLQTSKIQASGDPSVLLGNGAKWGSWFAQGQRALGTQSAAVPLPAFAAYPNPAHDELTVEMSTSAPVTLTLYDLLGRAVRSATATPAGRTTFSLRDLAVGTYVLRATDGQRVSTRLVTKE